MLKKIITLTLLTFAIGASTPVRAVPPLPVYVNTNLVIVGPSNALQIFIANFSALTNALTSGGFVSGGGGSGGGQPASTILSNFAALVTGTNTFYPTNANLQAGSLTLSNFASLGSGTNTFYPTNANLQAGSLTLSNFASLGSGTNTFYPTNANLQAGSLTLSNFASLGSGTNTFYPTNKNLQAGSLTTSNWVKITDFTDTNSPIVSSTYFNINGTLNVGLIPSIGYHFIVDNGGNVSADGTGNFVGAVTAPNHFLTSGRGSTLPAKDGITTNLSGTFSSVSISNATDSAVLKWNAGGDVQEMTLKFDGTRLTLDSSIPGTGGGDLAATYSLSAPHLSGGGSGISNLNASFISSGTIAGARLLQPLPQFVTIGTNFPKGSVWIMLNNGLLTNMPAGSDGQVLTSRSSDVHGADWETPAAGTPIVATVADASEITWDGSGLTNRYRLTLTGNHLLKQGASMVDGKEYDFEVKQNGTGGFYLSLTNICYAGPDLPLMNISGSVTNGPNIATNANALSFVRLRYVSSTGTNYFLSARQYP